MVSKMKLNDPKRAQVFFQERLAFTTGPAELHDLLQKKVELNLIDVREKGDYDAGHIPGAMNLPEDEWKSMKGLKKDLMNVVYCYSLTCFLAPRGALAFAKEGYPVIELSGGFEEWQKKDYEVEIQKIEEGLKRFA